MGTYLLFYFSPIFSTSFTESIELRLVFPYSFLKREEVEEPCFLPILCDLALFFEANRHSENQNLLSSGVKIRYLIDNLLFRLYLQ